MSQTTSSQTVAPQTSGGTAQPVITSEHLEAAQIEADYAEHLENRMGRYGY